MSSTRPNCESFSSLVCAIVNAIKYYSSGFWFPEIFAKLARILKNTTGQTKKDADEIKSAGILISDYDSFVKLLPWCCYILT